jgi:hypothetical protein
VKRYACVLMTVACLVAVPAGASASGWNPRSGVRAGIAGMARFEGGWIDLTKGWGPATACLVFADRSTECFRTDQAMQKRAASLGADESPALNCSTPLRLHDGTSQAGTTVSVFARGLWVDLSIFGFDNKTSSYTVGACPVELASGPGGTGNHYPRCLYAGCVENVMAPGWDNVVSSVYLH